MPESIVYPDADLTGPWQLNSPVGVDSAYTKPTGLYGYSYGYYNEDQASDAFVSGANDFFGGIWSSASVGDVAILMTISTDETDGTELGAAENPTIVGSGTNEVQTLSSDRTGGTFTLTFDSQTTGNLNWNDSAATIETALENLSTIGTGNVSCTGGPLPTDVVIEFTGDADYEVGGLAETDVSTITVTDSGTGGTAVSIAVTTTGVVRNEFTFSHSVNIPAAGDAGSPELHFWTRTIAAEDIGNEVSFTVADHDTLNSWAASCMTFSNVDSADPIHIGGENEDSSSTMIWPSLTLDEDGQVVVAVGVWVEDAGGLKALYPYPPDPTGYTYVDYPESDTITGAIWVGSSGSDTAVVTPPSVIFSDAVTCDWVSHVFALNAATPPTPPTNLYESVADGSQTTWLELKAAGGALYEVFELDLDSLPTGAVVTGISIEIGHYADNESKVRLFPVGINTDGSIVEATEKGLGYTPSPLSVYQEQETETWHELGDGSKLHSFDRLGIAMAQSGIPERLVSHEVYYLRARLSYDLGGPVVDTVTAAASAGDPIEWSYSSAEGFPQTHYRVLVQKGAAQDPDVLVAPSDPSTPATGETVYDSGKIAGSMVRELTINDAISQGAQTVSVMAWANISSGESVESSWTSAAMNLGGAPTAPTQTTNPSFSTLTGEVLVEVDAPASVSRAHLYRSLDAGTTWTLVEGGPFTVAPSTSTVLKDLYAPVNEDSIDYKVSFDNGAMNEASTAEDLPGTGVDSAITNWLFVCPDDDTLTMVPDIMEYSLDYPRRSVVVDGPDGKAVIASSGNLAARISVTVRAKNKTERLEIEALLSSGLKFRVIDILGREWLVRPESGTPTNMQRWQPTTTESTGLRDAHYIPISLIEVDE